MTRRGQQRQKALRNARRRVAEDLGSTRGGYRPPDRGECNHKQWEMAEDDAYTTRAQVNIWRRDGRLADFVVNVQVLTAEGWQSIERFDCCHGHCHRHAEGDDMAESLVRLDRVEDVQRAYAAVQPMISNRLRIIAEKGAGDG